jgi:hypothetical protein
MLLGVFNFLFLPEYADDMKEGVPLIRKVTFEYLLADNAFDTDGYLQRLDWRIAPALMPPKPNRKLQRDRDDHMCSWSQTVENYFVKITSFGWIETGYEKDDISCKSKETFERGSTPRGVDQ